MVARCNDRGLGTMTWEIARHLTPAKVLVVLRQPPDFVDEQRFPGARWVREERPGQLPDEALDWLLDDVDVIYTAETPYDVRLFERARSRGVGTALMGMYEYLPYRNDGSLPRPDLFLAPNPWHLADWPEPVTYLPVPVAAERFGASDVRHVDRIVHAAGAPAKGDRNGTQALLAALRWVHSSVEVVIRSQANVRRPRLRGSVRLVIEPPVQDYWRLHDGADAAVLPRRYGGLSLPLQEATAAGLPIIGLSREHDAGYDHAAVVRCTSAPMRLPCGSVERAEVDPRNLARAIDHLVEEPETVRQMAQCSRDVARGLSWKALKPRWEAVLGELAA